MFQQSYCANCHKEIAEVRITKIEKGEVTDIYLCQKCAGEYSQFQKTPEIAFSLTEIFENILKGEKVKDNKIEQNVTCKECGWSYEIFKKKGLLGCPGCYASFSDLLIPLLRRIHGSTQHIGKKSTKFDLQLENVSKIERLKKELENCIQKEDFERAASIRDKIKSIEKNLNENEPQ